MSAGPSRGTNALQKGLVILDCLAAAGGRLTFSELVEATGYPKGTLHRILAALLDHGSVRLDRDDNRYRFGWRVIEHARHASAELDVVSIAQGELDRLHTLIGEVVYLALPFGREVLCSTVIGEGRPQQHWIAAGTRLPSECTAAGKAVMAFAHPASMSMADAAPHLVPRTPSTITDREVLRAHLDVTKARRYAVEDEEWQIGVRAAAAPVVDHTNRAVAAIGVIGPAFRIGIDQLHELGAELVKSSQRLAAHPAFAQPVRSPRTTSRQPPEVGVAVKARAFLGENPVWDKGTGKLYWVDVLAPALHVSDPVASKDTIIPLSQIVGAVAVSERNELIAAAQGGFGWLNPKTGTFEAVAAPEADRPSNRFNNGKCDLHGRFWAGTMEMGAAPGAGSLYRLDEDGLVSRMETHIGVSNGIGWSPDDRTMYFADSIARTIYAYDFDGKTGQISGRRTFAHASDNMGAPVGLCVDVEGCIWSAHWNGWQVVRYAPDGRLMQTVPLPVPRPTNCVFGGPDGSTLYITTARIRLSPDILAEAPLSGSVLAVSTETRGVPSVPFRIGRLKAKRPEGRYLGRRSDILDRRAR
jgi:sugar lactone lactonase YvrE/DNA-binding IclR family transcriptional regulator